MIFLMELLNPGIRSMKLYIRTYTFDLWCIYMGELLKQHLYYFSFVTVGQGFCMYTLVRWVIHVDGGAAVSRSMVVTPMPRDKDSLLIRADH